jgi:hypothetical protein
VPGSNLPHYQNAALLNRQRPSAYGSVVDDRLLPVLESWLTDWLPFLVAGRSASICNGQSRGSQ